MKHFFLVIIIDILWLLHINAQEIMNVHYQGYKHNNLNINNIQNMTVIEDEASTVFKIEKKNGLIVEYDVKAIDSLTFGSLNLSSKQGFVIIRVDDSQPANEIIPMSRILDKFGFKMVNCFNPSIVDKDQIEAIKLFQSNGHEITDHTPNHTTGYADLKTELQKNMFVGRSGVERIDGLRVFFDWEYPDLAKCEVANDSIIITSGSGVIEGNFAGFTTQDQIYTTEHGWVLLKDIKENMATAIHAKSRQAILFKKTTKEQLYKVDSYSVFPTIDGMKSLMLASQLIFEYLGIEYYKYWCMCGGPWAMGRADILREAGIPLGYVGGSEHSSPNGNIGLTYNQSNPLSRWASSVATIVAESCTPLQTKQIIADEVAKHRGVVILGHMWYKDPAYTLFSGTKTEKFNQYLSNLEEVLQFCYDNEIPVLTYKDVIKYLYESKPDSQVNVVPPLYNDLTLQGSPDGYILFPSAELVKDIGVPDDNGYSLKQTGNGNIFYLKNIGGFEKGENTFSFYAKGAENSTLKVIVKSILEDKIIQTIQVPISGASNSFVKFTAKINIPDDADLFNIYFQTTGNDKQNFYISGIYIGKGKDKSKE